jgi:hypothetical protein
MNDAKFTAIQFKQQYGKEKAIEILEKMAGLNEIEATTHKNQAEKYNNAANILKINESED